MLKPLCCHYLRNCVWMAYWGSMSRNIFGRPLSFHRPPSCCAECSPRPDSRVFQKKGSEGFSGRNGIQKKPKEMDISLRQNPALKANTQGREATAVVHSLCVLSLHGQRRHSCERRHTLL